MTKDLADLQNEVHQFYAGRPKNSPAGAPIAPEHRQPWHDNHDSLGKDPPPVKPRDE